MNERKIEKHMAEYFGLKVEVVRRLEHCSLIRYGEREFVVDTADLIYVRRLRCAA